MSSDGTKPVQPSSIPLTWKVGGQVVGQQSLVQQPTEGEVNRFGDQRVKTCADCKFFDRNEKTVEELRRTDFWRKLRYEYQWKTKYLPGDPDELGLCRQRDGTLVGPTSGACDQYKLKR